jgi:hypothetical protein
MADRKQKSLIIFEIENRQKQYALCTELIELIEKRGTNANEVFDKIKGLPDKEFEVKVLYLCG